MIIGVSPQNHADSYKYMRDKKDNKYLFGFEKMWVLAPDRHGGKSSINIFFNFTLAHNWEGIGRLSPLTALNKLAIFTSKIFPDIRADDNRVIFTGHSMGNDLFFIRLNFIGGHGAWHLAITNPDKALSGKYSSNYDLLT